jgi:hypothetical protein
VGGAGARRVTHDVTYIIHGRLSRVWCRPLRSCRRRRGTTGTPTPLQLHQLGRRERASRGRPADRQTTADDRRPVCSTCCSAARGGGGGRWVTARVRSGDRWHGDNNQNSQPAH